MPWQRPWKVDWVDGSTKGNMAVVMLFGHGDGMKQTMGDPSVGDASALATPKSCFGTLTWGQRAAEFSGAMCGCLQAKTQRLGANGGDACGCRNPLGAVVVGIRPAVWLWVKTLDLAVSTEAAVPWAEPPPV
jgi:hypothetical protein